MQEHARKQRQNGTPQRPWQFEAIGLLLNDHVGATLYRILDLHWYLVRTLADNRECGWHEAVAVFDIALLEDRLRALIQVNEQVERDQRHGEDRRAARRNVVPKRNH